MARLGEILDEPVSGPAAGPPPRSSIWPAVHPKLLELIYAHRSTLIFVNARRLAERLASRLNELAETDAATQAAANAQAAGAALDLGAPAPANLGGTFATGELVGAGVGDLVKAHHGSLSREQRLLIEDDLKAGRLRALVATSSLELGIDMGAIDLVIQVESPGSVAAGLQRIGRAGHQVGQPSRGKIFPKHRSDLLETAVVVKRMTEGLIEETRYPRNPLDVLCQQIVAMAALDEWPVERLAALVRRSANFADLTDDVLASVLDLLAGRYPSEEFGELRPRIVWERDGAEVLGGRIRGRGGAQRIAVTNAGTIPDRGLFGVFLPDGRRVGELDEEMVYESRVGETFLLGASTWRIEDITFDRVIVSPAPGEPGKMPFWHGDGPGRPLELGRAVGAFVRELRALGDEPAVECLQAEHGLDRWAADNLVRYLDEQAGVTGAVPDDRTIVVERFKDEIGDWRICIHSPFGARVHAPWAMAIEARLAEQLALAVQTLWSDDGIVLRLPETDDAVPLDLLLIDPDEVEELVLRQLPDTPLFAARFRENAGRALLLPKRKPGSRTPLWQQRQRSADLLRVASRYPSFPMLLETTRECLADVFDLPALRSVLTDIRSRRTKVVPVETASASPFASSLLFGWIAVYMYEGDAPLAERRAAALALDRGLLSELLGAEELRELIDPAVLADLELELQCLVGRRRARDADEAHDLLRRLGDLSLPELAARSTADADVVAGWVEALVAANRAFVAGVAGEERVVAAEDAGRLRDALGVPLPVGLPAAFLEVVEHPLDELVARYARTHGPFLARQVGARLGLPVAHVESSLARLAAAERVVTGEFRPEGAEREWCDAEVLRSLRRRSLAALRREVEPVDAATLGRFLPGWHGVGERRRGLDAVVDAVARLQGAALPASVLEHDVLSSRVEGYRAADLDELCAAGEVVWLGAGTIGAGDGRVALYLRDQVARLAPVPAAATVVDSAVVDGAVVDGAGAGAGAGGGGGPTDTDLHRSLRRQLAERGASFWPELLAASGVADEAGVLGALWDLVWAGEVTNDTLAPLRATLSGAARRRTARGRPRPGRLTRLGPPAAAGRWSAVAPLLEPRPGATELAHARALALLERHGVLTRESVLAEGVEGGFAGVYGVLRALEERGAVRRGYFVDGLGAAQFALPGAVDRLRAQRGDDAPAGTFRTVGNAPAGASGSMFRTTGNAPAGASGVRGARASPVVLAATDPANPYGAALPWPESAGRPARAAGAYVVLVDGQAAAYLERGGRSLLTFPAAADLPSWVDGLVELVKDRRVPRLVVTRIDGGPPVEAPAVAQVLAAAGFVEGYRGLVLAS